MDPDVLRLAQVFAVLGAFGAFGSALALTIHVVLARTRAMQRRAEALPGIGEERLARMEQAIDVIAVEVERIAEAQRFAVQLMTERAPDRLTAPEPPGSDPPPPGRGLAR